MCLGWSETPPTLEQGPLIHCVRGRHGREGRRLEIWYELGVKHKEIAETESPFEHWEFQEFVADMKWASYDDTPNVYTLR